MYSTYIYMVNDLTKTRKILSTSIVRCCQKTHLYVKQNIKLYIKYTKKVIRIYDRKKSRFVKTENITLITLCPMKLTVL